MASWEARCQATSSTNILADPIRSLSALPAQREAAAILEQVHVTQLNANDGDLEYGALEACDCKPFIEMDEHGHVSYLGKASSSDAGCHDVDNRTRSRWLAAAFSTPVIDLHSDFSLSFNFYAGTKDVASGGMSFVLQSDPLGGDALGRGRSGPWSGGHPQRARYRILHGERRGQDLLLRYGLRSSWRKAFAPNGNRQRGKWRMALRACHLGRRRRTRCLIGSTATSAAL